MVGSELVKAGLDHYRGATRARALDVQPMAAHIDQLAVHREARRSSAALIVWYPPPTAARVMIPKPG